MTGSGSRSRRGGISTERKLPAPRRYWRWTRSARARPGEYRACPTGRVSQDPQAGLGACAACCLDLGVDRPGPVWRSEEHTSELQSLLRNSYAVFCLQKKTKIYFKDYTAYTTTHTDTQ